MSHPISSGVASIVFSAIAVGAVAQSTAPTTREIPLTGPSTVPMSTRPVGAADLTATVTAVAGVVQVRDAEDQPWRPAKVGMVLGPGAEFRTGLRSSVQFVLPPDQTITLDRLGTLKVLQAFMEPGKVTTDLGVKYGRTRYDIKSADLEHQSTIRSPGSTLAIRGTDVTYEDQAPWAPSAVSRTGRAEFRNDRRQMLAFGGTKFASVAADKSSAAEQALANTHVDPRTPFAGRTQAEDQLLLSLTPIQGTDSRGLDAVRQLARVGGFSDTFAGIPAVPGPLEFSLLWSPVTGAPSPINLDFFVTDPRGQTASAANPIIGQGSALGIHQGDNIGTNGSGAEGVAWGLFFPRGRYTVTATHQGGGDAQIFITGSVGPAADTLRSFGVAPDAPIILKSGESFTGTINSRPASNNRSAARPAAKSESRREK